MKTIALLASVAVTGSLAWAQDLANDHGKRDSVWISADTVHVVSLSRRNEIDYKMRFWNPDSTIDYKLHIVNPQKSQVLAIPRDSLARWLPELRDQLKRRKSPRQEK